MTDYTDSEDGFCVTVHQAQQNYPKAVKACRDGVAVMLVPEGVGEVTMQSGMAKEQNFLIHWHSPETKIFEIDNRSLIYHQRYLRSQKLCSTYFLKRLTKMWK